MQAIDYNLIVIVTALILVVGGVGILWHLRKKISKFMMLALIVVIFNVIMQRVDVAWAVAILIILDFYVETRESLKKIVEKYARDDK